MRHYININQRALKDLGIRLKLEESVLIFYMLSSRSESWIESMDFEGQKYFWFSYQMLVDQIGFLMNIDEKRRMKYRVDSLVKLGLLIAHPSSAKLNKSFFAFSKNAKGLAKKTTEQPLRKNGRGMAEPLRKNGIGPYEKMVGDPYENFVPNKSNTSTQQIKDKINIKKQVKRDFDFVNFFYSNYEVSESQELNILLCQIETNDWDKIQSHLPEYIKRTAPKGTRSNKQFRKKAANYLKTREWQNSLPHFEEKKKRLHEQGIILKW